MLLSAHHLALLSKLLPAIEYGLNTDALPSLLDFQSSAQHQALSLSLMPPCCNGACTSGTSPLTQTLL
jgi:hypothetical protein